jgi:hypothetical protein
VTSDAPSSDAAPPAVAADDSAGPSSAKRLLRRYGMTAAFTAALLVGIVFLWRGGQLGDTWTALKDADPRVLVAGGVLYLVGLAILCLRWHLLLSSSTAAPTWRSPARRSSARSPSSTWRPAASPSRSAPPSPSAP